jgi:hypothetical protein
MVFLLVVTFYLMSKRRLLKSFWLIFLLVKQEMNFLGTHHHHYPIAQSYFIKIIFCVRVFSPASVFKHLFYCTFDFRGIDSSIIAATTKKFSQRCIETNDLKEA